MFARTSSSAVVVTAVRQALGLMPLDLGMHVAEHPVEVVARERVVRAPDDVDRAHLRSL